MNKIQKNFKKQMSDIEKKMQREARRGRGVFSNKLFSLRFYGYNYTSNENPPIIFRFIARLFRLLFVLIFIIVFLFGLLVLFVLINKPI